MNTVQSKVASSKKTLTRTEAEGAVASEFDTDRLAFFTRHGNRHVRRAALHKLAALLAPPEPPAPYERVEANIFPFPFSFTSDLWPSSSSEAVNFVEAYLAEAIIAEVSAEPSEVSAEHAEDDVDVLAAKFPMFDRLTVQKTLENKGTVEAALRSLSAKRASLAKKKAG